MAAPAMLAPVRKMPLGTGGGGSGAGMLGTDKSYRASNRTAG